MSAAKRTLAIIFVLAVLLSCCALTALAAEDYADGTYTVPFSMDGLGRHNKAWTSATVHVEGGKLYVDFTIERLDPRTQPPQYDWLKTEFGTYKPTLNNDNFTCTFSRVQVPHLGSVDVTAQTSAMSQPYEVEYTINIDGSSIPARPAAVETTAPAPSPTPSVPPVEVSPSPSTPVTTSPEPSTPVSPAPSPSTPTPPVSEPSPAPAPSPAPSPAAQAEPSSAPAIEPSASPAAPAPAETGKSEAEIKASESSAGQGITTIGAAETEAEKESDGKGAGLIIAIVAAVVVIAACAAFFLRKARKGAGKK